MENSSGLKEGYADCFRIGHSAYKFVFDFGQYNAEAEKPIFSTRVIMGIGNAKDFFETFRESIRQYEGEHGRIKQSDVKGNLSE